MPLVTKQWPAYPAHCTRLSVKLDFIAGLLRSSPIENASSERSASARLIPVVTTTDTGKKLLCPMPCLVVPRRPIELPPAVARRFVDDMRAFFAVKDSIKRDEITARQAWLLNQHLGPREKKRKRGPQATALSSCFL